MSREYTASMKTAHYMMPNVSATLPRYTNKEQEHIRECFSSVSFKTIGQLPNELKPNVVNETVANHIDSNLAGSGHPGSVLLNKPRGPYFQAFPYMSTPFNAVDEIKRNERLEMAGKMVMLSHEPWRPSHTRPETCYNPPPVMFPSPTALAPHEFYSDPFEDADDVELRARWFDRSRILHGPFKAGGKAPSSTTTASAVPAATSSSALSPLDLPRIVKRLRDLFDEDWFESRSDVYVDDDGLIVVEFDLNTVVSQKSLVSYMNIATDVNPIVSEHGLRKVAELWGVVPNRVAGAAAPAADQPGAAPSAVSIYFAFRPPWLARAPLESYYALHPEKRSYQAEQQHLARLQQLEQQQQQLAGPHGQQQPGAAYYNHYQSPPLGQQAQLQAPLPGAEYSDRGSAFLAAQPHGAPSRGLGAAATVEDDDVPMSPQQQEQQQTQRSLPQMLHTAPSAQLQQQQERGQYQLAGVP